MPLKYKKCGDSECKNEFPLFNSLQKYCSAECAKKNAKPAVKKPPKPIKKKSVKQVVLDGKYTVARLEFLGKPENQICFIEGCGKPATTVEHRMGRKGYADFWARENSIPLTIDVRFFAGCCWEHNGELENNPELSKKFQLSKIHGGQKL